VVGLALVPYVSVLSRSGAVPGGGLWGADDSPGTACPSRRSPMRRPGQVGPESTRPSRCLPPGARPGVVAPDQRVGFLDRQRTSSSSSAYLPFSCICRLRVPAAPPTRC